MLSWEAKNRRLRLTDHSLGPDLAAVPVDDALNGGQSYPGAFEFFGPVQTLKHAEEFVDVLHVEARPVVPDENSTRLPFRSRSQSRFRPVSVAG